MQEEGNTEQKRHDPMIRLVKMPSMPPPRQLQPPWAHQAGGPLLSPTPCSVPTSPCHLPGKYTVFRTPHPHEACSPCLESRPRASAPLLSQQQQTPLSSLASYPGPATAEACVPPGTKRPTLSSTRLWALFFQDGAHGALITAASCHLTNSRE